ncbi:MAG: radical SAM protein [Chloroflexia bacterium]|nr:radical SAM protein [Chloroflexia bacterium]
MLGKIWQRGRLLLSYYLDWPLVVPRTCSVGVTTRCNSRCLYCSTWHNQAADLDHETDEFFSLFGDLEKLGVQEILLSGGEPLLRADLIEIIDRAVEMGFSTRLITNGRLLQNDLAYALASAGLTKIAVSLDSLVPEVYFKVRGMPLKPVLDGLESLRRVRDAHFPALKIALYAVIHRFNVDSLVELVDFAESQGFQSYVQPVQIEAPIRERIAKIWPGPEDIAGLEQVCQQLIMRKQSGYQITNQEDYLRNIPTFFKRISMRPKRCMAGFIRLNIDKDFGVRPCWMLDPVGNVKEEDIGTIWFSKAFRRARKAIRKGQCPGCFFPCHIEGSYSLGART